MLSARLVRTAVRTLDWLAGRTLRAESGAESRPEHFRAELRRTEHLRVGRRGEEDAYFALRGMGYVMVARNFRSARCRGEIDLIAWNGDVLCFIEVKTRTSREVKPGEAAVDRHKRREIAEVAREYLRSIPPSCQWRFDIVSVYYAHPKAIRPQMEVFRGASLSA